MKTLIEHIRSMWRCYRPANEAKSFRENQENEEAFDTVDRGVRTVPLDRIVGSVGRYRDFDRSFRPKSHVSTDRLAIIRRSMEAGRPMRPIFLYQIKKDYFVVDGNHRVAAAKELGLKDIQARILEFLPSRKTLENMLYREKSDFMEKTGLQEVIELTEIGQYPHLLEQILRHRNYLAKETGHDADFCEASSDWYETIYRPLTAIINKGGLLEHFPGRTPADLFAYISVHQWERPNQAREYGIGISRMVPNDMEEFRQMVSQLKESDYPEMVREITVFVLMNTTGRKENRLIEKLMELDEIREVHSVHGNVDIIVKIVLKRTLLSSDAAMVGEFVHDKIRQIPGVVSTQTLIPSQSHVKEPPRVQ
jgi:DNA-binding Lrp family transcriptional regulator